MRKVQALFFAFIIPFTLLCGCAAIQKDTEERPIRVALSQDMQTFDPILSVDIFSEPILRCVYTTLFDFDEELRLVNKLAKQVEALDDRTWKITIHSGVKFHNGSPLTADDVIYSIERARKGEKTKKLLEEVDRLEKVDDAAFLLYSKSPYPGLLANFAKPELSIVSRAVAEDESYDFTDPVGAGPYVFTGREMGKRVSLTRFADYFLDKAASLHMDFIVLESEQDRTAALLNGEVDLLTSVSAFDCDRLALSDDIAVLKSPSTKIEYLALNTHYGPLRHPEVRQAVSCAINREKLVDKIYAGYSAPSSSAIPMGMTGYRESDYAYDPQRARDLLVSSGYGDGFELLVITNDSLRKNALEYIKLDLEEIGIKLEYSLVDAQTGRDILNADAHQALLMGWTFGPDPDSALPLLYGTGSAKTMNAGNYSNPEVDRLLELGRGETDAAKRSEIYAEINRIVTNDSATLILHHPMILCAAKKEISGIHLNGRGLTRFEAISRQAGPDSKMQITAD